MQPRRENKPPLFRCRNGCRELTSPIELGRTQSSTEKLWPGTQAQRVGLCSRPRIALTAQAFESPGAAPHPPQVWKCGRSRGRTLSDDPGGMRRDAPRWLLYAGPDSGERTEPGWTRCKGSAAPQATIAAAGCCPTLQPNNEFRLCVSCPGAHWSTRLAETISPAARLLPCLACTDVILSMRLREIRVVRGKVRDGRLRPASNNVGRLPQLLVRRGGL